MALSRSMIRAARERSDLPCWARPPLLPSLSSLSTLSSSLLLSLVLSVGFLREGDDEEKEGEEEEEGLEEEDEDDDEDEP